MDTYTSRSTSNPGSTRVSLLKLLMTSPAPTSSVMDTAICSTTRVRRVPAVRRLDAPCRSMADTEVEPRRRSKRTAGISPTDKPVSIERAKANHTTRLPNTIWFCESPTTLSGMSWVMVARLTRASNIAATPPRSESTTLSVSS